MVHYPVLHPLPLTPPSPLTPGTTTHDAVPWLAVSMWTTTARSSILAHQASFGLNNREVTRVLGFIPVIKLLDSRVNPLDVPLS